MRTRIVRDGCGWNVQSGSNPLKGIGSALFGNAWVFEGHACDTRAEAETKRIRIKKEWRAIEKKVRSRQKR